MNRGIPAKLLGTPVLVLSPRPPNTTLFQLLPPLPHTRQVKQSILWRSEQEKSGAIREWLLTALSSCPRFMSGLAGPPSVASCNRGGAGARLSAGDLERSHSRETIRTRPWAQWLELLLRQQSAPSGPCGRGCGERSIVAFSPGPSRPSGLGWAREPWGRLSAVSRRAPEPSPQPPTGRAQALKQQRTSPPSPPPRPNGGVCLRGSWSVEASAAGVYGHCH